MFTRRFGKVFAALAAAVMVIAIAGYAMAGSLGIVVIKSTPKATVVVNGQSMGSTPRDLRLPAGKQVTIVVKADGYKTAYVKVVPKADTKRVVTVTLQR